MKKLSLFLLSCSCALLFTQCAKQESEDANAAKLSGNRSLSTVTSKALATTAAVSPGCNCTESTQKITGATAAAWAQQFAPVLKFDRAAPDYPTSVEAIWEATNPASIICGGKLILTDATAPRSLSFPTYYDVLQHPTDANRVFIEYWWLYKNQPNCFAGSVGGHNYDLEHIVIQFDKSTMHMISITYFQHAGWYTKNWKTIDPATRTFAYVGKLAHGSYHFNNTVSFDGYQCTYWGDYRNPRGSQDESNTALNLVQMSCDIPQFNFDGNWGDPGKGPLYRDRAYWNLTSCSGTDGPLGTVDGCRQCDFNNTLLIGNL